MTLSTFLRTRIAKVLDASSNTIVCGALWRLADIAQSHPDLGTFGSAHAVQTLVAVCWWYGLVFGALWGLLVVTGLLMVMLSLVIDPKLLLEPVDSR